MKEKPRIKYLTPPFDPAGWYVRLPGMPDEVMPERFDTWPDALARVKQWYENVEQRRRVQAKIAAVSARLIAGDRGSGVRGSGT